MTSPDINTSRIGVRHLTLVVAGLCLLLGSMFIATPDAGAAAPTDYEHDTILIDWAVPGCTHIRSVEAAPYALCWSVGTPCPAGTTSKHYTGPDAGALPFGPGGQYCDHGPFVCADGFSPIGVIMCRVDGHVEVTNQQHCADIDADIGGATWLAAAGLCAWDFFPHGTRSFGDEPPNVCWDGLGPVEGPMGGPACYYAWTRPGAASIVATGTPVCIESTLVQTDKAAAGLGVGNHFTGTDDDVFYKIISGPTTCKVNCLDGFDFNCDGVLGDVCPIELNLNKVNDAGICLELFAAKVDAAAVVPVVAAAGAGERVAVPVPGLAQTGSETSILGYLGSGLIAFGAVALGGRRKLLRPRR